MEKQKPMTEKEKMLAGQLYTCDDALRTELRTARKYAREYNNTTEDEHELRTEMLKKILGSCGSAIYIEPPFRFDYGSNIYVGENFYANFDCVFLDCCAIRIGNNCKLGPRVIITTATHPLDAATRITMLEYSKPVTISDNVWIGANATINPGVTIGDNAVIASGAVVTNDVPPNTVVAGVPARVIKHIEN